MIRTFVNGVTGENSQQEVHDLHIEYSQTVNRVHALGGVRGEFQGFDRPARQVNVRFPRALRPGETFSLAATTQAGSLAISKWWWTDGTGAKVSRTITVVDRRGREREAEISEYGPNLRGDEARTPELTEDVYSIINKAHHWGGAARRQGKVEIKMDIRPLLRERSLGGLDRDKVIDNVRAAIKQWTHCTELQTMRQVPRAGIGGQPSNHGPGRDPAVMAPGPSHQGARGQKFRSVTDRECDAAYFKYPQGLAIELITEGREGGDITAGWGVPSRYGNAMGVGPSEPDRRNSDRTATGAVHMRPQGSRSTKWHLAEDQDGDGFITNKDTDTVPEDAYDFYSIFKHELGHVLCFNHTGANFDDHPHFGEARRIHRDFSSPSDDRAPYPTSAGDHEHVAFETVYFASNRPGGVGGLDIWQAIFDGSEWSVSNPGPPINSPMDDVDPHLGSDGTTLLLSSNRGGNFDLYRTVYDLREDQWRTPEPIGRVNSKSAERSPSLTADMRTLFFSSDRPDGLGGVDVWVSEWIEGEGFSEAVNFGASVNTPANEADPMVSGDGRVLLLAADRPGGEGGYDLWRSFLDGSGWGEPVNLGPGINSLRDEREPGYPHHNGFLLFSSNRSGGPGRFDLYESWPAASQEDALETLPDDPLAPIEVGPRDKVGKESLGSKAARKAVGGVLGRVLGGSSGSSAPEGPRTRRDPTRRQDYVGLERPKPGITVGARSRWTDDGLLVSTRISDHAEKGTYHSVYLQSCDGRRLYPRRLAIYDLWAEHSLTVSWTRTTYVDGQVINRESGGWSDAWSEVLGRHTVDEAELPGIWQMYGYDRAHSGIQQLGAYFNLDPEQLAELGELALITHITRPEQDPVITEPFNWLLSGDAEQPRLHDPSAPIHQVTDAPSHWQQWQEDCDKATKPGTELAQTEPDGTIVERQPSGESATITEEEKNIEQELTQLQLKNKEALPKNDEPEGIVGEVCSVSLSNRDEDVGQIASTLCAGCDDPGVLRLRATGTPRGGQYSWAISRGDDKISWAGNREPKDRNASVGSVKPSEVREDAEVTVTYTVKQGSCSAKHAITVLYPTSLRTTDTWVFVISNSNLFAATHNGSAVPLNKEVKGIGRPFAEHIERQMQTRRRSGTEGPFQVHYYEVLDQFEQLWRCDGNLLEEVTPKSLLFESGGTRVQGGRPNKPDLKYLLLDPPFTQQSLLQAVTVNGCPVLYNRITIQADSVNNEELTREQYQSALKQQR